jgi:hypothetical protein
LAELWRASEHEPLAAEEWDAARAEEAIRTIVADAEAAFDGTRWPWHPRDGEEDEDPNDVYFGGAGIIWALHELGSTAGTTLRWHSSKGSEPSPSTSGRLQRAIRSASSESTSSHIC